MQADSIPSLQPRQATSLLLFFHGWGGTAGMLSHLAASQTHDIIVLSDYRDLSIPDTTLATIKTYQNIAVVAWSFGVWVAAYRCFHQKLDPQRGVAFNGTLFPIDENLGIPPSIAHATLHTLNARNMDKFRHRISGSAKTLKKLNDSEDLRRPLEALKKELEVLYGAFARQPNLQPIYQKAVIADKDHIFPPKSQQKAWTQTGVDTQTIAAPHFCFYEYTCWDDLLR